MVDGIADSAMTTSKLAAEFSLSLLPNFMGSLHGFAN